MNQFCSVSSKSSALHTKFMLKTSGGLKSIALIIPKSYISTLALFPAKINEISNPRLNAWLNRRRDWKVEMNGNQDNIAMGAKIIIPIQASYIRANSFTESHSPNLLTRLLHVIASCTNRERHR